MFFAAIYLNLVVYLAELEERLSVVNSQISWSLLSVSGYWFYANVSSP
jgi:hypothetical protein